ncbi:MAG: hypothetical protein WBG27_12150, partial [Candidatus Aquilonibacter sp.]
PSNNQTPPRPRRLRTSDSRLKRSPLGVLEENLQLFAPSHDVKFKTCSAQKVSKQKRRTDAAF